MPDYTTILDGLEVLMRLGIHPHEAEPQRVRLSVRLTVAYDRAPSADAIDEVLDYDFVRDGIHRIAANGGFALQETLCEAVAALCLADGRVREVSGALFDITARPPTAAGVYLPSTREVSAG